MSFIFLLAAGLVACEEGGRAPIDETCVDGTRGCACATGNVCGTDGAGTPLVCSDGLCDDATCVGQTGCVCQRGSQCSDTNDACDDGVCRPRDCVAGEPGCECLAGTCGPGLYCSESLGNGTCVDDTGFPGGACLDNGLCREQSRCDALANVCVFCERGSQGCIPRDDGSCFAGLFFGAGRCVPPGPPPLDSDCHTPCSADLVTSELRVDCRANGYMDGCVAGAECVQGTCLRPGESPPVCSDDADCASHQTCLGGRCASNCDETASCPVGLTCHDYVCRVPCAISANQAINGCPDGFFCDTSNGQSGVCEPRLSGAADGSATGAVPGGFTVDPPSLALSRTVTSGVLNIEVDSERAETLRVTKLAHRAFDGSGALVLDTAVLAREHALASTSGTGVVPPAPPAPLSFVTLRAGSAQDEGGVLEITAPPDAATLQVEVAFDGTLPQSWSRVEADLLVTSPTLGERVVTLSYADGVGGQWAGTMYYFAVFPDAGLDAWVADREGADILTVHNAFVRRLNAYRRGALRDVNELEAIIDATRTESWRWESVASACEARDGACYLYDSGLPNDDGIREYTSQLDDAPVPSGVTEFPIALRLASDPSDPTRVSGVVDSDMTLHYPGYPAVDLVFEAAPLDPSACPGGGRECPIFLASMNLQSFIGGREHIDASDDCDRAGFERLDIPWLLPSGFATDELDLVDGVLLRPSCRETRGPLLGVDADEGWTAADANQNLAGGNPLAQGRAVRRSLRLIDGVMVDQETLIITFEERFDALLGQGEVSSYGVMELHRGEPVPGAEMPVTRATTVVAESPATPAGATCSPELLASLGVANLNLASAQQVVGALVSGVRPNGTQSYGAGRVHYLCVDNGLFDGGPGNRGQLGLDQLIPCPVGSAAVFFAFPDAILSQADIADLPCQDDHSCGEQLAEWAGSSWVTDGTLHLDPAWSCTSGASCDTDRHDLRSGKVFSRPGVTVFPPLEVRVREAFRYKSDFQSVTGRQLGFAPRECELGGEQSPYCFDAEEIAATRDAFDCLNTIYRAFGTPGQPAWDGLREYLSRSLTSSAPVGAVTPGSVEEDGFERLYAELLVTQGDEAFTQALRSRFDLAASRTGTFLGEQLEFGAPNLSGIAGFELTSLYQSAQYQSLATERFYEVVAPLITDALSRGDVGRTGVAVVSPSLAATYLERVIGAATKKARTWSEIARRYQAIDRGDIAERVIAREYTASYLESVVLTTIMTLIVDAVPGSDRDQVRLVIESAQRQYLQALTELREVYVSLGEATNHFGYAPDYIPFPAFDANDANVSNGFEAALRVARLRAADAAQFEEAAIVKNEEHERSYEGFLQELIQIRRTYERTLRDICGSFQGRDGRIYPAISDYAEHSDETARLGDPCGLLGTGAIAEKILELNTLIAAGQTLHQRVTHKIEEMEDEVGRAQQQCDRIHSFADYRLTEGERVISMNESVRRTQLAITAVDRAMDIMNTSLMTDFEKSIGIPAYVAVAGTFNVLAVGLQARANTLEERIERVQLNVEVAGAQQECLALSIDHESTMLRLNQELRILELDAFQHFRELDQRRAELERFYLEAQSVQQEQREAEQLRINSEAAYQDPNRRIYRNAAVYNADRSFETALRHAYRATLMFEYFTSQSYASRGELYLVRMVQNGFNNLTIYLNELEDAYEEFREVFSIRALRVERLSVRDDLLPLHRARNGVAFTRTEQRQSLYDMISDPAFINAQGQLEIDFRTSFEDLSPCTFSHQIDHIEAVLVGGSSPGSDQEADLLIWQEGTGTIQDGDGELAFYRLPDRLVVANPRFDGATFYDPSVYRRYELRQRPYVNTSWRMILDQRNNPENADIDLRTLEDIHLYIYYTDFTNPEFCR